MYRVNCPIDRLTVEEVLFENRTLFFREAMLTDVLVLNLISKKLLATYLFRISSILEVGLYL